MAGDRDGENSGYAKTLAIAAIIATVVNIISTSVNSWATVVNNIVTRENSIVTRENTKATLKAIRVRGGLGTKKTSRRARKR